MIKNIKSTLLASVKSKKINIFVLFLLFAFVILIFTKLSKPYTNTIVFNIEKVNIPKENVILNDSLVLTVTLKTHGFKWLSYNMSDQKIKIDFSKDVYKKDSLLIWSKPMDFIKETQFDSEVELLNIYPDTLMFRYDVNLVKKVPVIQNSKIEFAHGFNVSEDYVLEPDSIEVIGPNLIVSKIDYIETKNANLLDVRSDISERIGLKLPKNKSDLKFSNTSILLEAKVEKFTEGTLKVPVTVINVPKEVSLKYFPKEVNVSYSVSLHDFKTVKASDFYVVCDYQNIENNESVLIAELEKHPKLIKNVKMSQQRIEFIITK